MLAIESPQQGKGLFCKITPLQMLTSLSSMLGADFGTGKKLAIEVNLEKMEACLLWSLT